MTLTRMKILMKKISRRWSHDFFGQIVFSNTVHQCRSFRGFTMIRGQALHCRQYSAIHLGYVVSDDVHTYTVQTKVTTRYLLCDLNGVEQLWLKIAHPRIPRKLSSSA